MPGSGRTALEAGALSVIEPGDRVLVVGAGLFGVLMREIMGRVGADVTEFPVEWGARLDLDRLAREAERLRPKAITLVHNETSTGTTYPAAEVGKIARAVGSLFLLDTVSSIAGIDVRTDEWGVDLNMTGSQKCLAAPLGLSLVSREPAGVGGHGAAQDEGALLRLRPAALEGAVDPGLARRQGAGRHAAPAAGLDPDAPHRGHARGRPAHPRGRACRTASAVTRWRPPRCAPASPRWGSRCSPTRRSCRTRSRAIKSPQGHRPRRRRARACATATASSSAPGSTRSGRPRCASAPWASRPVRTTCCRRCRRSSWPCATSATRPSRAPASAAAQAAFANGS